MNRSYTTPTSWLLAALALCSSLAASAQPYPHKLVRVVLSSPGGGTDIVARMVAETMAKSIGVSFIVESRQPSVAAAAYVARAAADGSVLMVSTGSYLLNALLRPTQYDPVRDFASVSLLGTTPIILIVHPALPVGSLRDLVALAKQRPGELSFGSGGIGSPIHLAGELFKQAAQVDIVHVPFKGTAHAATDLIAGRIELLFSSILSVQAQLQADKVKALTILSERRAPELPAVPTTAEAGLPGLRANIWYSMVAPANTPRNIVERLSREAAAAVRSPAVSERFRSAGVEPTGSTAEQHAAFVAAEQAKWRKVITDAHIDPRG
jgi:tripartite-type tricarboxylate transporter receptor subunit TctC